MLAEPRSRQKWSDDPRNTRWASDKSKFGYQMLTKMGWSEGAGLGQTLQGQTSHIKIKKKRNGHGIGMKTSHDDDWIAHQDSFNALLSQLNSGNNDGSEKKIQSLEQRVRLSRTKIMYSRFVKSKDLSRASSDDLASIFGQRSKSAPATPQRSEDEEDNQSDVSTASCPANKKNDKTLTEHGITTVNSGVSVADYFAQKMAALKRGKSQTEMKETGSGEVEEEKNKEETRKEKKKKKKKQKVAFDICEQKSDDESRTDEEELKMKKKKKQKKTEGDESGSTEGDDVEVKKKKKKRKEHKSVERNQEIVVCEKKTFSRDRADEEATVCSKSTLLSDTPTTISDTPLKKKKKKQKQVSEEESNSTVTTPTTKKTKKKKRKHEENDDTNGDDSGVEERKRKRKKRHQSDGEDES